MTFATDTGPSTSAARHTQQLPLLVVTLLTLAGVFAASCGGNTLHRDEYGSEWPLTVDEATLGCYGDSDLPAPYFEVSGVRYPITGWAETILRQRGYEIRSIDRIWRNDPDIPGIKVNLGPWIDRGSDLC